MRKNCIGRPTLVIDAERAAASLDSFLPSGSPLVMVSYAEVKEGRQYMIMKFMPK